MPYYVGKVLENYEMCLTLCLSLPLSAASSALSFCRASSCCCIVLTVGQKLKLNIIYMHTNVCILYIIVL